MSPLFDRKKRTLVVLSQVYVPDPASVGQHMHDVSVEMVRRGWQVVVFASDRGYDDPSQSYKRYEVVDGVRVVRVPWSSFGKSSIAVRLAGAGTFLAQASLLASALPRIDHLLVSTSPPICALAGVALSRARGVPLTFWAMDINPDQIVATGSIAADSAPARAFDWMNRQVLAHARHVVALDRFMAERLNRKLAVHGKLVTIPPWPHMDSSGPLVAHADNPFRAAHGLRDKFVVMYSGNLSPVHPVATILEVARRMQQEPNVVFLFIGGGLGRREIEDAVRKHGLSNVRTLPYQPLSELRHSLSAADVHVVSMGDAMVGIVHPSKIYGAMAVGRPVLVLGPKSSHLSEIVVGNDVGWQIEHGDVDGCERLLRSLTSQPAQALLERGQRARAVVDGAFSKRALCAQFCDVLEAP